MGLRQLTGDSLPLTDYIARWCKPSHCDGDEIGFAAFMLEQKDADDGLSVNWLEFFESPDRRVQIAAVQRVLAQKMTVRKNSRLAVLNVGTALANIGNDALGAIKASIQHSPDKLEGRWEDPSHSSIFGLTRDISNATLAATALCRAISEVHPATP